LTLKSKFVRRLQFAAVVITCCILTLSPWVIRNWLVLGHPVIATTHGGYTLWLANNDFFYDYLEEDEKQRQPYSSSVLDDRQILILRESNFDEVVADRRYQQLALETIYRRPALFTYSCTYRILSLWHPLPAPRTANESWYMTVLRMASSMWYLLLFIAAITGMLALKRRLLAAPWWWSFSLLWAFTIAHTFYWTDIRMRAPLIPALALIGAFGFRLGALGNKEKNFKLQNANCKMQISD
jgi:hypothetical protein